MEFKLSYENIMIDSQKKWKTTKVTLSRKVIFKKKWKNKFKEVKKKKKT